MRTTIAGLLLCCTAASLSACASDKSPPTAQSAFPPATPGVSMATAAPSCGPHTHTSGLLIDNVTTPPAFGGAVREDGMTYFTELCNGGGGIRSSQTCRVGGWIATRAMPVSPD